MWGVKIAGTYATRITMKIPTTRTTTRKAPRTEPTMIAVKVVEGVAWLGGAVVTNSTGRPRKMTPVLF